MAFVLGLVYMLMTGVALISMSVVYMIGKKETYNRISLVIQGLVALWCVSQVLLLLSSTEIELKAAYLLGNIGICFLGAFWYYFAASYTGGKSSGFCRYAPFSLSLFHFVLVLTNHWHHLYYTDFGMEEVTHGIFFYTNVIMTYAFVLIGAVILYRNLDAGGEEKKAKYLIITSVLVPLFLNLLYLTGLVRASFDITPLGFGISIICVLCATVKYRFMDLHRELEVTNERLLLEQERNRIAQQVHDTAGHTLTMILSYMKLAEVSGKNQEQDKVSEYIAQARLLTSEGIKELRHSINQLRREAVCELVTQGIMHLANQVKEIPVEVTVQGEDSENYSHLSRIIYDSVRESITNTLKYANASKMEIIVRFQKDCVELVIADDGEGCELLAENNGIRGIRERVEKAGGKVKILSAAGEGFLTRIMIPV